MSQATAPSTAASTLDVKNKELERQLESVTAHRDELSADVEALCNASSGNIFGASNALKSRIAERQREANKLRRQLDAVTRECSTLHQDLANHRQTKQTVDQQWRLERERLESELTCRQNHSAQPLSVWDKAVSGAEDLKEQLLKIEGEWQNMRDELGKEKEARVEAERQLQEVMQQKDSLQAQAEEVPGLRGDLAAARQFMAELELRRDSLQGELSTTKSQHEQVQETLTRSEGERRDTSRVAAAATAALEELKERLNTDNACLKAEVTRLQRERAELKDRVREAECGLVAAQADMEIRRERLEEELAATRTDARRTAEKVQLEHSSEVTVVLNELEESKKEHEKLKAELRKAAEERKFMHVETAAAGDMAMPKVEPMASLPQPTSSSGCSAQRDLPLAKQQQQRRDDREEMPMALMWELTATLSKMDESSLTDALEVVTRCQSTSFFTKFGEVDLDAMEPATLWKLYNLTHGTAQASVT